ENKGQLEVRQSQGQPEPMLVFIAILYLILVAITPFVAFYLLGKYKKLRAEFDQSKEEQAQQRKSLQREIADLKEQLASAVPGQSAGPERPVEPVTPAAAPTREGPLPPSRVEFPGPVEIPPPAAISPQKPVMPPTPRAPSVPSTEVPARAKTLAEVKPSVPATTPTPKPTLQQRMKTVSSIEETLGTNWLLKIGVTLFVMGMAYLGIQELRTLGAAGKALLSYLAAATLLIGGIYFEKKDRYRLIGRG